VADLPIWTGVAHVTAAWARPGRQAGPPGRVR